MQKYTPPPAKLLHKQFAENKIYVMAGAHYIDLCNDTENDLPRYFICNGQPHQLHAKLRLSQVSFLDLGTGRPATE